MYSQFVYTISSQSSRRSFHKSRYVFDGIEGVLFYGTFYGTFQIDQEFLTCVYLGST